MGFDPRRWRPSSGSRPLTTNVEALLAENEALRREVRSLRLQLEAFLQGDADGYRSWQPMDERPPAEAAAPDRQEPWSSSARSRASRNAWTSAEPPRSRVTVGSSHGISADLVERWGLALARHPRWPELRIGPPGGLRSLEEELRRHWWNPSLSLEQELDRLSPGLGAELLEALRGPHSRVRWAVRAAFALYGPRAPEWLSEEPLRVVEEQLRRVQQLERQAGSSASQRRGTRTANTSGGDAGPSASRRSASGDGVSDHGASDRAAAGRSAESRSAESSGATGQGAAGRGAAGRGPGRSAGRGTQTGRSPGRDRQADAGRQAGTRSDGAGPRSGATGQSGHRHSRGADRNAQEQASAGSQRASSRQAPPRDPRSQALALLGLEPGATAAAIKRAYRRLAKAHHPDLGGDAEAFLRLDAAYRSLL